MFFSACWRVRVRSSGTSHSSFSEPLARESSTVDRSARKRIHGAGLAEIRSVLILPDALGRVTRYWAAWDAHAAWSRMLFPPGRIVLADGAVAVLHAAETVRLIRRHLNGDWAEMDDHDQRANRAARRDGTRLQSKYTLQGGGHCGRVLAHRGRLLAHSARQEERRTPPPGGRQV